MRCHNASGEHPQAGVCVGGTLESFLMKPVGSGGKVQGSTLTL